MEIKTQVVCDGVRIDKNIIPTYLTQLLEGKSSFSIEYAFYSGIGETCQSGNCGKHINNIYVIKDKSTGQEYHVGCECVRKYSDSIGQLISYWKSNLESAKRAAIWKAKRALWTEERDAQKRASIEKHREELEFIAKYLQIMPCAFLESIQNVIENGWHLSEKQRAVFTKIMTETDFVKLEEQAKENEAKYGEIVELIQILDHVKMGLYPGASQYESIRSQFDAKGILSEKQITFLRRLVDRFRKQLEKI